MKDFKETYCEMEKKGYPDSFTKEKRETFQVITPEYINDLSYAFKVFSKEAQRMKVMYEKLERRVKNLTEELERKNCELEEAKRLAYLGELAAGVAHEIRNPLGGIELCASLLQRETKQESDIYILAGHILEGVKQINRIVTNLLSFSRNTRIMAKEVNVIELVEDVLKSVSSRAEEQNVDIEFLKGGKDYFIIGDMIQLRQVFVNIVTNAIEAMPEGGKLTVELLFETQMTEKDSTQFVVIIFRDTGVGMNEEIKEKVFNPFFTTKDTGTGLGLAISYKIVRDHQGKIVVESKKGEGTTFKLYFPRSTI